MQMHDAEGSLFVLLGTDSLQLAVVVSWWTGLEEHQSRESANWRQAPDGWVSEAGPWGILLSPRAESGGIRLDLNFSFEGAGSCPALRSFSLSIRGLEAARQNATASGLRVAYCGAHSRSQTSRSLVSPLETGQIRRGWWVGAVSGGRGPNAVLGVVQVNRFVTEISFSADSIGATQHLDNCKPSSSSPLIADPLWLWVSEASPLDALETYAALLGQAHQALIASPPSGWGSWGHWLERIDRGLILETLMAVDEHSEFSSTVQVIQIDDGWSELLESGRVSASWRPNRRFPSGVAPLASEIARRGRQCGLWLLPFTVNAGSHIVSEHPEWLVQNSAGAPLRVGGGESYCLDPTHPGAAEWLRALCSQLSDWGIKYLKLDHLRALVAPDPEIGEDGLDEPRHYFGGQTRVEAYRVGLRIIRDAMGDEAVIVGCSAPAAAGTGIVTTQRVGPDIEPRWAGRASGIRDAAQSLLANWFWHGRAWLNDPDYLLPCDSEEHTRFWATVVAMSGGSSILSADIHSLSTSDALVLRMAAPSTGRAARPLDLFAGYHFPRYLQLPLRRGDTTWEMIGLLNWDASPALIPFDVTKLGPAHDVHAWDVWREAYRRITRCASVTVGAEDAMLFRITPVLNHPQVVGTDMHWAQGWLDLCDEKWDPASHTLDVQVSRQLNRNGHAWVWVPPGWGHEYEGCEGNSHLIRVAAVAGSQFSLRFAPPTADSNSEFQEAIKQRP